VRIENKSFRQVLDMAIERQVPIVIVHPNREHAIEMHPQGDHFVDSFGIPRPIEVVERLPRVVSAEVVCMCDHGDYIGACLAYSFKASMLDIILEDTVQNVN